MGKVGDLPNQIKHHKKETKENECQRKPALARLQQKWERILDENINDYVTKL
jgi:hypothetical protein